jgi:hypothetical protein
MSTKRGGSSRRVASAGDDVIKLVWRLAQSQEVDDAGRIDWQTGASRRYPSAPAIKKRESPLTARAWNNLPHIFSHLSIPARLRETAKSPSKWGCVTPSVSTSR